MPADLSGNGGSFIVLASHNGGGPGPRWQLVMDPNWRQWTMTVDYSGSGLDGGSWSCWLLTRDYDASGLIDIWY